MRDERLDQIRAAVHLNLRPILRFELRHGRRFMATMRE